MFAYSDDNKRYHTLNYHNLHTYGKKMQKAAINAGLSCPNIDGVKGVGGCIFCSDGSGYFTASRGVSIAAQLDSEILRIRQKDNDCGIIAYFQSNSNTYAPINVLKELYDSALSDARISALSIATRPDCINDEIIKLLSDANSRKPITVELGLQTMHDVTAEKINRCHSYDEFLSSYHALKSSGLRTCVHIINGLPEETPEMMTSTAKALGALHPDAVKIHLLHVIRGTALHNAYDSGLYKPMDISEYILTVVKQLRVLPPETVIERITGDGDKSTLLAPLWSRDKRRVLGSIDRLMAMMDAYQGDSI